MILKCIIISDEIMARENLERLSSKHSNLEIIEAYKNYEEALETLSKKSIDLIFLDIEMPGKKKIELLEKSINLPQVIFSTSKAEYEQITVDYHITDFLKKPISIPRFLQAIDKAMDIQRKNNAYKTSAQEIYIEDNNEYIKLSYNQILYFETVGEYVKVVTSDKEYLIYRSMKNVVNKLNHPRFLKVHNSYIINLSKIKTLKEGVLEIGENAIPISRSNKSILMSKLNIL